jgi:hypothetical protein
MAFSTGQFITLSGEGSGTFIVQESFESFDLETGVRYTDLVVRVLSKESQLELFPTTFISTTARKGK